MTLYSIINCARCGGTHVGLEFHEFRGSPIKDESGEWNAWALCPNSGDPILQQKVETNDHTNDTKPEQPKSVNANRPARRH